MSLSELVAYQAQLKAQGKELSNNKEAAKVYNLLQANPSYQVYKQISKEIITLESKLDSLDVGLSLTDAEKDLFLEKAIAQITPYYEQKKAEIEAGIQEGKVQSAEDILATIRDVETETKNILAEYDIDQAQTEQEFVDTMANITSITEADRALKQEEWSQRIQGVKLNQVQSGVFASGVGKQKRDEAARLRDLEMNQLDVAEQARKGDLQRDYTFDLERIKLARQKVQDERANRIGTGDALQTTQSNALSTLGYSSLDQLPSRAEIASRRAARDQPIYDKTALTSLGEQRSQAVESRNQELQADELAIRKEKESLERNKILSELAAKRSKLSSIG